MSDETDLIIYYRNGRYKTYYEECDDCGVRNSYESWQTPYGEGDRTKGPDFPIDMVRISKLWGYNSMYDMDYTEVQLCSKCWTKRLGDIHRIEGYSYESNEPDREIIFKTEEDYIFEEE